MRAREILKQLMVRGEVTQDRLAKEIGVKNGSNIQQKLRNEDIKCGDMGQMVRGLGYRLVVVRDGDEPEERYEVT